MIVISRMLPWIVEDVQALYRACHPGWPDLPKEHFFAYPTLVAYGKAPRLLGYASYGMNVSDQGDLSIVLKDSGVAESARGRGLARELLKYRVSIGQELGAKVAIGATQPDNAAMLHILRTEGFDEIRTVPNAYPDGGDGVLFLRNLEPR